MLPCDHKHSPPPKHAPCWIILDTTSFFTSAPSPPDFSPPTSAATQPVVNSPPPQNLVPPPKPSNHRLARGTFYLISTLALRPPYLFHLGPWKETARSPLTVLPFIKSKFFLFSFGQGVLSSPLIYTISKQLELFFLSTARHQSIHNFFPRSLL